MLHYLPIPKGKQTKLVISWQTLVDHLAAHEVDISPKEATRTKKQR